jgi:hypothetical protein
MLHVAGAGVILHKSVQLMEYFRDEKNRIQAGFALNAGELLKQYTRLTEGVPRVSVMMPH